MESAAAASAGTGTPAGKRKTASLPPPPAWRVLSLSDPRAVPGVVAQLQRLPVCATTLQEVQGVAASGSTSEHSDSDGSAGDGSNTCAVSYGSEWVGKVGHGLSQCAVERSMSVLLGAWAVAGMLNPLTFFAAPAAEGLDDEEGPGRVQQAHDVPGHAPFASIYLRQPDKSMALLERHVLHV